LAGILGARLDAGLVITKHVIPIPGFPFTIIAGSHPVPDIRSLEAGQKALEFLSTLGPNDLLFCLISGGGSALVTTPLPGTSMEDIQAFTSALLACGANINEINTLRRRLERLKGGGLVRLSNGATIASLILSDVVGSPLEAIASGPTAPDPSTRSDVLALLDKYELRGKIPVSIQAVLEQAPETPKPGDPIFANVQNLVVGSGLLAAQAALAQAAREGFTPYLLRIDLQGEAYQAAFELATFLRQAKKTGDPVARPACIVAGGETTVTLRGKGKGGRNTELALVAVTELADFPGVMLVTLATDGEDGPTDAAGAVVTGESFRRAAGLALHPDDFLSRNDSYSFFAAMDDLLKPGPTGTNVNDLVFLFVL
jgi:glycerate 2-kinase